jgi:hypothetical protein
MNKKEDRIDKDMQHAWKRADWYFERFCKDRPSWEMDLKAVGDSNEKILQEYITTAFWAGYLEGLDKGENRL